MTSWNFWRDIYERTWPEVVVAAVSAKSHYIALHELGRTRNLEGPNGDSQF